MNSENGEVMFTITEAAAGQVRQAARQGGAEGMALRLAAQRAEDGSIDYLMGFDEANEEDIRIEAGELVVVWAREFIPLLKGATMDYVELEEGEFRFIFLNPNDDHYVPPEE
jgi:iron-sulfur cluster assembly protein